MMPSLDWNMLSSATLIMMPTLPLQIRSLHPIFRDNSPTHTTCPLRHHRHHHSTSAADWPSIFQIIVPGRRSPFPHPRRHPIHHMMTFMAVHQVIPATTTPPTNLHNPMNHNSKTKQYTTHHDDNIYSKCTRPLATAP
jgi:hypothetical protein